MDEFIKREDIKKIANKLISEPPYQHEDEDFYCGVCELSSEIDDIPTADVVEVVHGKWLQTKYEGIFECSECYEEWYVTGIARVHPLDNNAFYCPCCGAKMVGRMNDVRNL